MPLIVLLIAAQTVAGSAVPTGAVVDQEFVFETAPFASAHASTIVETRDGLVTSWFGGTREGAPDVGIWVSRHVNGAWTPPIEVATGVQADGTRHPCWNPVLFDAPARALMLFYKVGPSPQTWWGMVRTSRDHGRTWSDARRLPDGILGPIKNKPVRLADGTLLAGSSTESADRPSVWRVHFERSRDGGLTWTTAVSGLIRGWHIDRRDPAGHPRAPGWHAAGGRPYAIAAHLRHVVRGQRRNVDAARADDAAESELRHRRSHASRRPAPDRLQPYDAGAVAVERRNLARRQDMAFRARAGERPRVSTRIPR